MQIQIALVCALFGLAFGSFINAAVYRLFNKTSLNGRSNCIHCSYVLRWYDLIPLGSFIVLQGKCRSCRKKIPTHYFFVELATAILFGLAGYFWQLSGDSVIYLFRDLFIVFSLVFLFVFDAKYYLLPDAITIPSIFILLIMQIFLGLSLFNILIGVAIGAGFFLFQFLVSKGKWVGGGDIRLGALMGGILGWPLILVGLFISYVMGAIIAIPLLVSGKKQMGSKLPFGTFLTVGTLISLWWGQSILDWYLSFL